MVTYSETTVGIPKHIAANAEFKENFSWKMGQANVYKQIRQGITCVYKTHLIAISRKTFRFRWQLWVPDHKLESAREAPSFLPEPKKVHGSFPDFKRSAQVQRTSIQLYAAKIRSQKRTSRQVHDAFQQVFVPNDESLTHWFVCLPESRSWPRHV